jgi:hypothetical protein
MRASVPRGRHRLGQGGAFVTSCFRNTRFFGGDNVKNHYGSQWVDQDRVTDDVLDEARRTMCSLKGGVADTYAFVCGIEYCCGACHEQQKCGETHIDCACLKKELGDRPPSQPSQTMSWAKQREDTRRALCAEKGGVDHTYGSACGVEYCCGPCHGQHACEGKLGCACLGGELDVP